MWKITPIELILKYDWKIARSSSSSKLNYIITYSDFDIEGKGECAPNIRYLETQDLILSQFESIDKSITISNLNELTFFLNQYTLCASLRFGLESSWIHWYENYSKTKNVCFFKSKKNTFTSYTIPIIEPDKLKLFFNSYHLERFKDIKLKINSESGLESIKILKSITNQTLFIDANEAWEDVEKLIKFIELIKSPQIKFLEQPMPEKNKEQYIYLKKYSSLPIFADESITFNPDWEYLSKGFHGINMKLMKAGGYLNGYEILNQAKKYNLLTMIGCMVETSLGISSGIRLAHLCNYVDLDGSMLVSNEPFNLIEEKNGIIYSIS